MGDSPLTPEELDALVKLDEAIRADNVSPNSLDPSALPPEMRSVAGALWSLNQSYVARTPNTFSGMPAAIGKYRIRSVLGVGGYGIVYLGDDPQLQRVVAIKVPLPGRINDRQGRERYGDRSGEKVRQERNLYSDARSEKGLEKDAGQGA